MEWELESNSELAMKEIENLVSTLTNVHTTTEVQLCIMRIDQIFHDFEKKSDVPSMRFVFKRIEESEIIVKSSGSDDLSCILKSWLISHSC